MRILNIILSQLHKRNSQAYIKHLRKKGVSIGSDTIIYQPNHVTIDLTRPWLIQIGNHVRITKNVTILTHGYDWSVIKRKTGKILGSSGKVKIGNNVFIGVNSTILKGVTIGDNVIIGANSLINKDIPNDVVVAGNPARVICTLSEYEQKREKAQLNEALELAIEYKKIYHEWPSEEYLREFIWLFKERSKNIDKDNIFMEIGNLCGNIDQTKEAFYHSQGIFDNYESFIQYCKHAIKE